MSTFIEKINTADRLAALCRQGFTLPITVMEQLVRVGWYDVKIEHGQPITAKLDGVQLTLGEL